MMVSAFEPTSSIDKNDSERIRKPNGLVSTSRLSPPTVSMMSYDVVSPPNHFHPEKEHRPDNMEDVETEDEEVKMNCINGVQHSDFEDENDDSVELENNDDSDDDVETDDDEINDSDEEEDENDTNERVVNFVGGQSMPSDHQIKRPLPVKTQSPVQVTFEPGINMDEDEDANSSSSSDDNDDDDTNSSTSSSSSSNARGCPIELSQAEADDGSDSDSSDSSNSSDSEEENIDDENDDDEIEDVDEQDDDLSASSQEEEEEDEDGDNDMSNNQTEITDSQGVEEEDEDEIDEDENNSPRKNMESEESDEDEGGGGGAIDDEDQPDNASGWKEQANKDLSVPEEACDTTRASETGSAVSNNGRRPSLSMDEIEDMLEESSSNEDDFGEESSDEEEPKKSRLDKVSEAELVDLFSDSLEFDYWSPETLKAAVDALSSISGKSSPIYLPERDNDSFWVSNMTMAILPESKLRQYLDDNPDQRVLASRIVFDAFHTAMSAMDLTRITMDPSLSPLPELPAGSESTRLFIGDFAAAESRLALAAHRIKRIIQISYHPLDELWKRDGITYSTHILPSLGDGGAAPVHEAILMAAEEVASALNEHSDDGGAVLVACSTGDEHACAVCALYLSQRLGLTKEDAASRISELRPSCRIDLEWLHSDLSPRTEKTKRVLSCNMLSRLSRTASNPSMDFDSPKRMRRVSLSGKNGDADVLDEEKPSASTTAVPFLPALDLGEAVSQRDGDVGTTLRMRGSEEYISSSAEEEEEDMLHSEELEEINTPPDKPSTPIPLLTPPASPVRVETNEGTATACEWPSNLAVDTAMAAVADLRPLSPNSLQKQEEEEEERILAFKNQKKKEFKKPDKSTLTPLIRGISIQFEGPSLDNT